jgi:serine/threonine-protein phosphatase 2A activator
VVKLRELLREVERIIDEVPPETGPRRFGNAAFRTWFGVLEERVEGLLGRCLKTTAVEGVGGPWERWGGEEGAMGELKAYFLGGWGSKQRLDNGTGHELSFLAFLGGLWKLGVFGEGSEDGVVERSLVLGVFEP